MTDKWPFKTKPKAPDSARSKRLRWMARNLNTVGFSYMGDRPEQTSVGDVEDALRELADRLDAEATQEPRHD